MFAGEQINLFPEATSEEINQTKTLLSRYRRMKSVVSELEHQGVDDLATKPKSIYNAYKQQIDMIERCVNLILDDEVRRIIEMRYIRGQRHKITVMYFSSMHASTVDRKINEGIRSIANSLKLFV